MSPTVDGCCAIVAHSQRRGMENALGLEAYNSGSRNIEEIFKDLIALAGEDRSVFTSGA